MEEDRNSIGGYVLLPIGYAIYIVKQLLIDHATIGNKQSYAYFYRLPLLLFANVANYIFVNLELTYLVQFQSKPSILLLVRLRPKQDKYKGTQYSHC